MRPRLTFANACSVIALVVALAAAGGASYATHLVVRASDIVTGAVRSDEVRDDTRRGGGLRAVDLRPGSVGQSEVADGSLGPADIRNAQSGSDDVNADRLDGQSAFSFFAANRVVMGTAVHTSTLDDTIVSVPGLVRVATDGDSDAGTQLQFGSLGPPIEVSTPTGYNYLGYTESVISVPYSSVMVVRSTSDRSNYAFVMCGFGEDPDWVYCTALTPPAS